MWIDDWGCHFDPQEQRYDHGYCQSGSNLSIWGFACHLPLLMVGSNKRWISMAKTNWDLSHRPSTFHKSVSFYHLWKDCFNYVLDWRLMYAT